MSNKYDSYKDSGIEWIGKIPRHWKKIKFSYITNLMTCGHASTPEYVEEGGIPFLSAQNIKNEKLDLTVLKQVPISLHESLIKNKKVKKGDLLQVRVGGADTIGQTAIVDLDFDFSIYVSLAHIKLNELAFNGYVKHLCNSVEFKEYCSVLMKKGAGIANLNVSDVASMLIPLPDIEEQTTIANYLNHKTSQIDDLIAKKERLIQLLDEERTAIINQAVTKGLDPTVPMKDSGIEWLGEIPAHWEVKKLKQIFNSSKGLTITKENLESDGIPCVNYGEIHSKFGFEVDIDKHQLKFVNPTYLESDYKSLIQTGDFVFADTSEDISGAGNFTYLKSNHEIFAGYHTIILRAQLDIESRYFAYQFDSIPYRTQIRQSVKGIKVFSITQGILKNTSLWIPPIDEQKQIIEFLDIETDRIVSFKNSTRKEIELLKEYKTALISEVVTGKVDVRDEKLS